MFVAGFWGTKKFKQNFAREISSGELSLVDHNGIGG
jgi:hypothetical protein